MNHSHPGSDPRGKASGETEVTSASTDQAIDGLLAALRGAELPAGLEDRLLARLDSPANAAAAPAADLGAAGMSFGTAARSLGLRSGGGLSLAAAVVILLVALAFGFHHPGAQRGRQPAPADAGLAHVGPTATRGSERLAGDRPVALRARPREQTRRPAARPVRAAAVPRAAESFPAPPMPLTRQEKLLLRAAHRRGADDPALLRSAVRSREGAPGGEPIDAFLRPPPLLIFIQPTD